MKALYLMIAGALLLGLAVGTVAGVVPAFSTAGTSSCVSVYGIDPIAIKGLGTQVSAQSYFNYASVSPVFAGFGPWQGPVTETAGLNPPATTGAAWGATPTGSPVAVQYTLPSGYIAWTNPNGGPIAFIEWENTIYSLPPGTYYWSTTTGYFGTTAPTLAQSGGSYGSASISVTTYYDLALYLSGGCYEGSSGGTTTTTTTTSAPTSSSTVSSQSSIQSQTVTNSVTGQGNGGHGYPLSAWLFGFSGLALLSVGAWMEKDEAQ